MVIRWKGLIIRLRKDTVVFDSYPAPSKEFQ